MTIPPTAIVLYQDRGASVPLRVLLEFARTSKPLSPFDVKLPGVEDDHVQSSIFILKAYRLLQNAPPVFYNGFPIGGELMLTPKGSKIAERITAPHHDMLA